jgi:hypothetical protein
MMVKEKRNVKVSIFYIFTFFYFICTNGQTTNNNIDYGNGIVGDISFYVDYRNYINDSIIPFSYNILHEKKENYIELKLKLKKEKKNLSYSFDNKIKIFFDQNKNLISVKLKKINYKIEDLLKRYTDNNLNIPLSLLNLYEIDLCEKKYIIMNTSYNSNLGTYNSLSFTFVFEVNNDKVSLIPFKSSSYSSILCFGDFDNDMNLDYLFLDNNKIDLFSNVKGNVVNNSKYYLSLKFIETSTDNDLIFIDLKNSKWSFLLNNSWDKYLIKN